MTSAFPQPARARIATLCAGASAVILGLVVRSAVDGDCARATLIDRPLATAEAHGERLADLRSEWSGFTFRLGDNLRVGLLSLGFGLLLFGALRPRASLQVAATTGAVLAAGAVLVDQIRLLDTARREGVFSESRDAHASRFFDRSAPAAEILNRIVPPGARFLVIDWSSPRDVNKLDYLAFPRRMYTLPGQIATLDADRFRALLASRPDALAACRAAGYEFAVDLDRLVTTLDPAAIVAIGAP